MALPCGTPPASGALHGSAGCWSHILEQHRFPLRGYDLALWLGGPPIGKAIDVATIKEAAVYTGGMEAADALPPGQASGMSAGARDLLLNTLQVAVDETRPEAQDEDLREAKLEVLCRFRDLYRACFTLPHVRELLSRVPNVVVDSLVSSASSRALLQAGQSLPPEHPLSSTSLLHAATTAHEQYVAQALGGATPRLSCRVYGSLALVSLHLLPSPPQTSASQWHWPLKDLGRALQQLDQGGVRVLVLSSEVPLVDSGPGESLGLAGEEALQLLFDWLMKEQAGCRVALLLSKGTGLASDIQVTETRSHLTIRQICLGSGGLVCESSVAGTGGSESGPAWPSGRFRLRQTLPGWRAASCGAEVTIRLEHCSVELEAQFLGGDREARPCRLTLGPIIGKVRGSSGGR